MQLFHYSGCFDAIPVSPMRGLSRHPLFFAGLTSLVYLLGISPSVLFGISPSFPAIMSVSSLVAHATVSVLVENVAEVDTPLRRISVVQVKPRLWKLVMLKLVMLSHFCRKFVARNNTKPIQTAINRVSILRHECNKKPMNLLARGLLLYFDGARKRTRTSTPCGTRT